MTTDTHPKEAALRVEIGGRRVTIGGIAKGTGMIHPMMATMFCFVATDLGVERDALQGAFGGRSPARSTASASTGTAAPATRW